MEHLEECRLITLEEWAQENGIPDPPPPNADDIYLRLCDPDCPIREEMVDRGRELAERYGW